MIDVKTKKGKGLSALLTDAPQSNGHPSLVFVKIADITPSPLNPRKHFEEHEMDELTASVLKMGVIQPITVRLSRSAGIITTYEIVCGERRFKAALSVKTAVKTRDEIPASIVDITDAEAMELMVTENLQRKDVHPLEEGNAFQFMIDKMNYSVIDIAAKIGKNEPFVIRRLQLLNLIKDLKEIFLKNELSIGHAELLSRVNEQSQLLWFTDIYSSPYSGGQGTIKSLKQWLSNKTERTLSKANFKLDAVFEGKQFICASCTNCPKNSSVNHTLFPDSQEVAICYDSHCFEAKDNAAFEVVLQKAIADPEIVLIEDSYDNHETSKKLKKNGFTVLKRFDDYEKITKPEKRKYFTNDTEETIEARYQEQLAEYQEKKKRELKGFNVAGDDRGKVYKIVPKSNKNTDSKADSNPAVARKALIAEVKQKKDRGRKLDAEKVMKKLVDHMTKLPLIKEANDIELTDIEKDCLIALAFENNGAGDAVKKLLRLSSNMYSYQNGPEILKTISEASPETRALIVRTSIFYHYCAINPKSMSGGVIFHLAKQWCPEEFKTFELEQGGIRERREAKLDQKVKEFDKNLLTEQA